MDSSRMTDHVERLLPARRGHFLLESGHHGDLWLDLEVLCYETAPIRELVRLLSRQLEPHAPDIICGPLIEGAFVGLMVAEEMGLPFAYSNPRLREEPDGDLFPVEYDIPALLRSRLAGRRIAIVNDLINAGSAVRGTIEDLRACDAAPVAIACLAVLGEPALRLAAEHDLPLERLCDLPNRIWEPRACPLCAQGVPMSQ
jgi:orotate phosphoribosyltransferase